ncbi:MAG: glycosyltransferase [Thermoleophilia bacterium]|nr:glycosyltransferase [Thermoleophilia bacterium]
MDTQARLSVIIPTRDRGSVLAATLADLAGQRDFDGGYEVVVVDNGSSDGTREVLARAPATMGERLVTVEQPRGGPAAARNAAIGAARGEILLLLGDDTAPAAADLLAAHAALHREHPESTYACLGRIEWTPRAPATEFMRWLDNGGPQFHYWEIAPGPVRIEDYFYSSHVSLKRSAFDAAGGFDVRFPYAALEDADLGRRLAENLVSLDYHPELVVWHDHATTIEQSLARTVRVGRCAALYNEICPERPHPRIQRPARLAELTGAAASPALAAISWSPAPPAVRRRIWSLAHRAAYARGYRLGPPEAR